ncbi:hypothetical protein CCMSSC00406_0005866 [Pleurotus cornucopiae]|uniref:Uncharacterized protein n=1 Tax=Pleurotus cornucopiae TaxID=5321 RepID=A0ACB7J7A6_PLECO|nr:hypothetical protein CCMSSC00406_0005866 [Pleurotus cornucopiae]
MGKPFTRPGRCELVRTFLQNQHFEIHSEATGAPFHNFIARSAETHPACIVIFSKMAFLGLRKWPTPFLKPMWPFMAAGTITFYLVAKLQDAAVRSPEFAKDPRNPYAAQIAKEAHH